MERSAKNTRHILTQESNRVVQMLDILKLFGYIVIGAQVLVDNKQCPIGACTTLIKTNGVGDVNTMYLHIRVDCEDKAGNCIDVDFFTARRKRNRREQKDIGIKHHHYL